MQGFGRIEDGATGEVFAAVYRLSCRDDVPGDPWMGTLAVLGRGAELPQGAHVLRIRDGRRLDISVWAAGGGQAEFTVAAGAGLPGEAAGRAHGKRARRTVAWPSAF